MTALNKATGPAPGACWLAPHPFQTLLVGGDNVRRKGCRRIYSREVVMECLSPEVIHEIGETVVVITLVIGMVVVLWRVFE